MAKDLVIAGVSSQTRRGGTPWVPKSNTRRETRWLEATNTGTAALLSVAAEVEILKGLKKVPSTIKIAQELKPDQFVGLNLHGQKLLVVSVVISVEFNGQVLKSKRFAESGRYFRWFA